MTVWSSGDACDFLDLTVVVNVDALLNSRFLDGKDSVEKRNFADYFLFFSDLEVSY